MLTDKTGIDSANDLKRDNSYEISHLYISRDFIGAGQLRGTGAGAGNHYYNDRSSS